MATAARSIAASTATPVARAIPSLSAVEAGGQASPSTLPTIPCWANCAQGRALLVAIKAERPDVVVYDDGLSAWNGRKYNGPNAAQLRKLFDRTYQSMMNWVDAARADVAPGRPQPAEYEKRHDAVAAWAKDFGPERVIARVLGEAL